MRRHPDHPLAGKTGLLSEARAVLYDRIGPGPHPCHWCGTPVDWQTGVRGNARGALVADHFNNDPLDDSPDNIVAACGKCNAGRGQAHRFVSDDEPYVTDSNGHRHRALARNCEKCGKPFLVIAANVKRPGTGRFCSRSCARSMPRKRRAS